MPDPTDPYVTTTATLPREGEGLSDGKVAALERVIATYRNREERILGDLRKRDDRITVLESEGFARGQMVDGLRAELAQRDETIAEQSRAINRRDTMIASLRSQIARGVAIEADAREVKP